MGPFLVKVRCLCRFFVNGWMGFGLIVVKHGIRYEWSSVRHGAILAIEYSTRDRYDTQDQGKYAT